MTKKGRTFGGIFTLIGSGLLILVSIIFVVLITGGSEDFIIWTAFFLILATGVLGVVGGILLLTDKTVGGVLSLISGAASLIINIWSYIYFVGLWGIPPAILWAVIFFFIAAPGLILTGAILGLVVGSEL
ncbi:MAG: hypothetical protein HWN65_00860 [Candidatus Helarchaeota archaeon]|nr:hypothetical protein [Candidatus Helarchaeota archaeon]